MRETDADLPLTRGERQSAGLESHTQYGSLLSPGHRPTAVHIDFAKLARGLLTRKFRVAIVITIGLWPFDCVFLDFEIQASEIEQTSESPFVAWHA
jgi:hypothetical protein